MRIKDCKYQSKKENKNIMKYFYFIKADIAYMYLLNEYAQKKRFPLWKTQKILLNYCKSIDTKSV